MADVNTIRPPTLTIPSPPRSPPPSEFAGSNRFELASVTTPGGSEGVLKTVLGGLNIVARERCEYKLKREMEAYQRIESEVPGAVPRLLSIGDTSFVVERMGLDLFDSLVEMRPALPSLEMVRNVLLRLSWALSQLHAAGITHNDIKPENIVQGHGGGFQQVYIIDLESVRYRTECKGDYFETSIDEKTPGYAAPEAWKGLRVPVSCWGAEDAFGLGRIAHALLTGEPLAVKPYDSAEYVDWATYARECVEESCFSTAVMSRLGIMMPRCIREALSGIETRVGDDRLCRVLRGLLDSDPVTRMSCGEAHAILLGPPGSKKRKRPASISTQPCDAP